MSRKAGLQVKTDPQVGVTRRFFEALAYQGEEAALAELKAAALDDAGAPTPRTQTYVSTGEWDAREKIAVLFARSGTCFGRVGVSVGGLAGTTRFCGRVQCPTVSHKRGAMVDAEEGRWYIQGGPRSTNGFFVDPWLPAAADGGPVPLVLEEAVTEIGTLELRLTVGQWKFLFEAWQDDQSLPGGMESLPGTSEPGSEDTFVDVDLKDSKARRGPEVFGKPSTEMFLPVSKAPGQPTEAKPESMGSTGFSEPEPGNHPATDQQMQDVFNRLEWRLRKVEERAEEYKQDLSTAQVKAMNLQGTVEGLRGIVDSQQHLIDAMQKQHGDDVNPDLLKKLEHAVLDPRGSVARLEHEVSGLATRFESGGGVEFHTYTFASDQETVNWFDGNQGKIALFADAVALLHSINATVVHTAESNRSKEAAQKVKLESELEASIVASFSTTLPSIFVGNQKDTQGGAYECLMAYLKAYTVWSPVGPHASSGLKNRIRDGTRVASTRLRTLQNVLTANYELKEVATMMMADSMGFIMELTEFVGQQYSELRDTSSFSNEAAWSLIVDCIAQIFVELSEVRGAVVDAGNMQSGMFLWGMFKAWEIQERYRRNQFKNDPALTGLLVRRILVHDGEQSLKDQLEAVGQHTEQITALKSKVEMNHKEFASLQKKLKKAFPDKFD